MTATSSCTLVAQAALAIWIRNLLWHGWESILMTLQVRFSKDYDKRRSTPRTCTDFQVIAHGPLFPAIADASARAQILNWQGNVTGALEKGLCNALKRGGYRVLNTVNDSNRLCWRCWRDVHQAFKWYFPKIASYPT